MNKQQIVNLLSELYFSVKAKRENYRIRLSPEAQAENHPETNKWLQTQFDFTDGQVYELQYILDRISEESNRISHEEKKTHHIVTCRKCK